jgi:hypothetical protein
MLTVMTLPMIVLKAKEVKRDHEVFQVKQVKMEIQVPLVLKGTMEVNVLYADVAQRVLVVIMDLRVHLDQKAILG